MQQVTILRTSLARIPTHKRFLILTLTTLHPEPTTGVTPRASPTPTFSVQRAPLQQAAHPCFDLDIGSHLECHSNPRLKPNPHVHLSTPSPCRGRP